MALKIANLKQQTFFASYEENAHLPEPERQRTAWREAYGRWSPFRPHVVRVLVAKWDAHVAEEAASVQETPPHPLPTADAKMAAWRASLVKKSDPIGDAVNQRLDQVAAANRALSNAAWRPQSPPTTAPSIAYNAEQYAEQQRAGIASCQPAKPRRPTQQRPIDPFTGR
jgi:hypothetical protein